MTDTYGSTTPLSTTTSDEIDEAFDTESARLSQTADAYLAAEDRAFDDLSTPTPGATTSIRQSLREGADQSRVWAGDRASRVTEVIRNEPVKATAYALVGGVFLGMMLRR